MNKPVQQRTLKTRAKLLDAARQIVTETGYESLRTDDVVKRAAVAKGTLFAHFADKDALLDQLIGADLNALINQMADHPAPTSVAEVITRLEPLMTAMSQSRMVFDVILRHSGAAKIETIGPIAESFGRQIEVTANWFAPNRAHPFRRDVGPELLAEGIQAFSVQAMALKYCALHNTVTVTDRMVPYLTAWLTPGATQTE